MSTDYEDILEALAESIFCRAFDDIKHDNCAASSIEARKQQIIDAIVRKAADDTSRDEY